MCWPVFAGHNQLFYEPTNSFRASPTGHSDALVQRSGGFSRAAAAAVASGHKAACSAGTLMAIFPENLVKQEMSPERWVEIPEEVREIYALWRPTPLLRAVRLEKALQTPAHIYYKYEGASPAGSHKPNTAVAAGVLQQGRGHETAGDRDGRGPVGFVAGAGVQAVWPGMQRVHGQGQLPAKAVSPDADAHLGRDGASQPERPDRIRAQGARRRPELPRQPRHCHQRSHRGHGQASEHEVFARQRAQSRVPAPDRHRPGSHQADGNGRRRAGRDHRLLRRRQQFFRASRSRSCRRKSPRRRSTASSASSRPRVRR